MNFRIQWRGCGALEWWHYFFPCWSHQILDLFQLQVNSSVWFSTWTLYPELPSVSRCRLHTHPQYLTFPTLYREGLQGGFYSRWLELIRIPNHAAGSICVHANISRNPLQTFPTQCREDWGLSAQGDVHWHGGICPHSCSQPRVLHLHVHANIGTQLQC